MVAVYCVLPVRAEDGVNVAVLPLRLIVPITEAPPAVGCNVKVPLVNVRLSIGAENVAATDVLRPTFVALLDGDVAETVNAGGTGDEASDVATTPISGCSPLHPSRLRLMIRAARKLLALLLVIVMRNGMRRAFCVKFR
jgi:hypothetical protein